MTFGSLFTGIGGIDLGLERAGMTCRWQVEIDEYCRGILARHWPNVQRFEDVRSVGREQLADVDLVCGGFPCTDISNAGKRAGIDGEQSGLWREFARIIGVLRPPIVLLENVAAITVRGIDRVLGDLASLGYDAEWTCFRAADVGAYHLRNRWWCVAADANNTTGRWGAQQGPCRNWEFALLGEDATDTLLDNGREIQVEAWESIIGSEPRVAGQEGPSPHATSIGRQSRRAEPAGQQGRFDAAECGASAANANSERQPGRKEPHEQPQQSGFEASRRDHAGGLRYDDAATIRPRLEVGSCFGGDFAEELAAAFRSHRGEGGIWETFSTVGCLAHGVSQRVAKLRALGNAVVPQVAEVIGKRIMSCVHQGDIIS